MFNNSLGDIIHNLQQLKEMHQLKLELLEQLDVTCGYVLDSNISVPNREHLASLLIKTKAILAEISSEKPQILIYRKIADEKKHLKGTDEEVPVPFQRFCQVVGYLFSM